MLEGELPEQQFNTWVRPLQAVERDGELKLLAPNRYVIEWLGQNLLPRIKELILAFAEGLAPEVALDVGTRAAASSCRCRRRHCGMTVRRGGRAGAQARPGGARQPHQCGIYL